jgi:hypothetical protein
VYELTRAGREALERHQEDWRRFANGVSAVVDG